MVPPRLILLTRPDGEEESAVAGGVGNNRNPFVLGRAGKGPKRVGRGPGQSGVASLMGSE